MTGLTQRAERALKTMGGRSLRWQLRYKRLFARPGRTVFVTALPKSGSTFLVNALREATGFLPFFLGANHLNEQDLYLPKLLDAWSMDIVCHQHTRATAPNLSLMRDFGIRPVVLARDLFDCTVSLCDHLETESGETPVLNVDDGFAELTRTARLDLVIDLALPWYLQFIAGWSRATDIDTLWLSYESVMADKAQAVAQVLAFHGIDAGAADLDAAVARAASGNSRFNQGRRGRGRDELTTAQQARIATLAGHFPDVDFSLVGLPPSARAAATA